MITFIVPRASSAWWANFAKAVAVKYNGRAAGTFRIFLAASTGFEEHITWITMEKPWKNPGF
jgi:hypothetical protein